MEPEKSIRGQDGSQEKKEVLYHQHKEIAGGGLFACAYACVCVCALMCVRACVHSCVIACMVRWREGQHPQPPARTCVHRCPAGWVPADVDTPALGCQNPVGA